MCEQTQDDPVEVQRTYDMIHRDATAHISSMKTRQWTITHYAILVLSSLFYLTTTKAIDLCAGKPLITIATVSIVAIWYYVTYKVADSLAQKRGRLNILHKKFTKSAASVYGEIKKERESIWYDSGIYICQFLVIIAASLLVAFNAWDGNPVAR